MDQNHRPSGLPAKAAGVDWPPRPAPEPTLPPPACEQLCSALTTCRDKHTRRCQPRVRSTARRPAALTGGVKGGGSLPSVMTVGQSRS